MEWTNYVAEKTFCFPPKFERSVLSRTASCLCTASHVERTRLAVHKQSFLNLLKQNGGRVTKVYSLIPLNRVSYVWPTG